METENKYRKDTTEDHPLFNGDPTEYFLGKSWRKSVPMTCGPRGFWFKIVAELDGEISKPYWVWIDG